MSESRYEFGPRSQRGLMGGWQSSQLVVVAVGLAVAVEVLRMLPDAVGVVVGCAVASAAVAFARWPLGGRSLLQWSPAVLAWLAQRRAPVVVSRRPYAGTAVGGHGRAKGRTGHRTEQRSGFEGLHLFAAPPAPGRPRLGVVHDGRYRRYTAVVMVEAPGAMLGERAGRARRSAGWGRLLASLAAESDDVRRVQWIARRMPSALTTGPDTLTLPEEPTRRGQSYRALLEEWEDRSWAQQTLVALTVSERRAGRPVRGGGGVDLAACDLLADRISALCMELERAGLAPAWPLGPDALSETVLQAFSSEPELRARAPFGPGGRRGADSPGWPWPTAIERRWSSLRTGGTWHATYWVAEWPRSEVGPDFLTPLLFQRGARITMSTTLEPTPALRAARDVEQARTAELAEAELRRRHGFVVSARRQREAAQTARLAAELADGHAQFRFSGYVGVAAAARDELEVACDGVERVAAQAGLDLRRLYGQIDSGLACLLPLGRGLS
ncbi:MAG: hypothetical protein M0Z87_00600 [Actinomycetota bacterium]|nr:hypothetical protein [Actinomycetota bacterium]